jgi:hypothetical protein
MGVIVSPRVASHSEVGRDIAAKSCLCINSVHEREEATVATWRNAHWGPVR